MPKTIMQQATIPPEGKGMVRRTLARSVRRTGHGLHSGRAVALTLTPARFGAGIVFVTPEGRVPADVDHASPGEGATVLAAGHARISTPEHVLAALAALGVTDAEIHLVGGETPALDGSALPWVEAIDEAGRADGPPLAPWTPLASVAIEHDGGRATIEPGGPELHVRIDYGLEGPSGALLVPLAEKAFRDEVCWARTFVLSRDVERLRAAGRGGGATEANTVVWPGRALRSPDEPVRHKALDAWGDLALLGPLHARVTIERGTHALHLALARAAQDALRAAHDQSRWSGDHTG
jgi:UDP-3-O-[3-hydroxymyristoyl] N-acetylglucosamine deacetylase